jgi:mono/diheme cytochrome c family protein
VKRISGLKELACAAGGLGTLLVAGVVLVTAAAPDSRAGSFWDWCRQHMGPAPCAAEAGPPEWEVGGTWYWQRSPDEEKRVVAGLFNRYCIRCHGVDGRGVWDIPGVPDFTNTAWQASRSDAQIALIVLEGRGAVMPPFRGTLSLEEAWAMARYLRTFPPGTEQSKPVTGQGPEPGPQPPARATLPPAPAR